MHAFVRGSLVPACQELSSLGRAQPRSVAVAARAPFGRDRPPLHRRRLLGREFSTSKASGSASEVLRRAEIQNCIPESLPERTPAPLHRRLSRRIIFSERIFCVQPRASLSSVFTGNTKEAGNGRPRVFCIHEDDGRVKTSPFGLVRSALSSCWPKSPRIVVTKVPNGYHFSFCGTVGYDTKLFVSGVTSWSWISR